MSRSALALVILVAFLEAKTKKMVARLWGPQTKAQSNLKKPSASLGARPVGVTLTYMRLLERGGGSLRPYALALT